MVALPDTDAVSGMPFAFDMAMAVRHRDKALKATPDSGIDRRRAEITAILDEYSVPMIQMHPYRRVADGRPYSPTRETGRADEALRAGGPVRRLDCGRSRAGGVAAE